MNIYVYTYRYVIRINKKKGHKFERMQEKYMEGLGGGRRERASETDEVTLSSQE